MRRITTILIPLLFVVFLFGCTVEKPDSGSGKSGKSSTSKYNPNASLAMDFGTEGQILVTLSDVNKMSIIDMATFKIADTIDVGVNPQDVVFSPDGKYNFAAMPGKWLNAGGDPMENDMALAKDSVWTWDASQHRIMGKASTAKSDENSRPVGLAVTTPSDRLLIANMSSDELVVKNLGGSQDEVARITVGAGPRRVLVTPDNKYAITINTDLEDRAETDSISIVHLLSYEEEGRVDVGAYPWAGAVTSDNKTIYVSISGADEIVAIDIASRKIANTIKVGKSPRGIKLSSDDKTLYVASYGEDMVIPVDLTTNTLKDGLSVAKGPIEIASGKGGELLFVACAEGKSISVINTSQNSVVATIKLKGMPSAIAAWTGAPPKSAFPESKDRKNPANMIAPGNVQQIEENKSDDIEKGN